MNEQLRLEDLTETIIGDAIRVHRALGPGLLESAYTTCLAYQLARSGLNVVRQQAVPLHYEGVLLHCGYRLDIVVNDRVILEIKSVRQLEPIHEAQMLTYLKLTGYPVGLLINFNVQLLKQGIKRRVYSAGTFRGPSNASREKDAQADWLRRSETRPVRRSESRPPEGCSFYAYLT